MCSEDGGQRRLSVQNRIGWSAVASSGSIGRGQLRTCLRIGHAGVLLERWADVWQDLKDSENYVAFGTISNEHQGQALISNQSLLSNLMQPQRRRVLKLFLAKTAGSSEWKAVSAAVKTLVEEATFDATSEALTFRAMDPSHVALVDLLMPNSSFERFECEKPFKFSVRVEDLVKLIGRSDTKDSIEISSTEEDAINVKFMNGYKREFTIHLIESGSGTAPLPKLEFTTKATLTKTIFEKVLSDISVVSDQVTIQAAKDRLSFSGKSDVGKAAIELQKNDADVLDLHSEAEDKATYSIDYLLNIAKAMGAAVDTIVCEFSSKKPIKLAFKLNDQGSRIHYYLAPRVSE